MDIYMSMYIHIHLYLHSYIYLYLYIYIHTGRFFFQPTRLGSQQTCHGDPSSAMRSGGHDDDDDDHDGDQYEETS